MFSFLFASFLLADNHCFFNNWPGSCPNRDSQRNVLVLWALSVWCQDWAHPHGGGLASQPPFIYQYVGEKQKAFCITLIWSHSIQMRNLRLKRKLRQDSMNHSLFIGYSIHIHWISGMYKICTAVVSLSFERFSYFNTSPTIPIWEILVYQTIRRSQHWALLFTRALWADWLSLLP